MQLIVEQGNDYVVTVKGNQPTLMQEIERVSQQQEPQSRDCQTEQSRDRRVERTVSVYADVSGLHPDWPQAQSLVVVQRQGTRAGQAFERTSYYLSSLAASAVELGLGIRGHRLIENGLHWVKDVVFGEDGARFGAPNAASNWSTLRTISINVLRSQGYHAITQALRRVRHDLDALFHLLTMN